MQQSEDFAKMQSAILLLNCTITGKLLFTIAQKRAGKFKKTIKVQDKDKKHHGIHKLNRRQIESQVDFSLFHSIFFAFATSIRISRVGVLQGWPKLSESGWSWSHPPKLEFNLRFCHLQISRVGVLG